MSRYIGAVCAVLAFFVFVVPGVCRAAIPYTIVAGTAYVEDVVRDLLPGKVEILTVIPASSCPGHHDIRASDMVFFAKADMVIIHEWQQDVPGIVEAMDAVKLSKKKLKVVRGRHSMLVPESQIAMRKEVASFLLELPAAGRRAIRERLADRIEGIAQLAEASLDTLAPYKGTPVLCSSMQEEFARWAGMDVKGTYGRAEDLSPDMLMQLAALGRKTGVRVVVDNVQSGAEAGKPLASELNAAHVSCSNFPMSSPDIPSYMALLRGNVDILHNALASQAGRPVPSPSKAAGPPVSSDSSQAGPGNGQ